LSCGISKVFLERICRRKSAVKAMNMGNYQSFWPIEAENQLFFMDEHGWFSIARFDSWSLMASPCSQITGCFLVMWPNSNGIFRPHESWASGLQPTCWTNLKVCLCCFSPDYPLVMTNIAMV
jgi:hypothetical protein